MPSNVVGLVELRDIPVEDRAGDGQLSECLAAAALLLQGHGKHEIGRYTLVPALDFEGERVAEPLFGGSEVPQTVLGQARGEEEKRKEDPVLRTAIQGQ